jgi:hypothetical protein
LPVARQAEVIDDERRRQVLGPNFPQQGQVGECLHVPPERRHAGSGFPQSLASDVRVPDALGLQVKAHAADTELLHLQQLLFRNSFIDYGHPARPPG